jgi:hypothetical protein
MTSGVKRRGAHEPLGDINPLTDDGIEVFYADNELAIRCAHRMVLVDLPVPARSSPAHAFTQPRSMTTEPAKDGWVCTAAILRKRTWPFIKKDFGRGRGKQVVRAAAAAPAA